MRPDLRVCKVTVYHIKFYPLCKEDLNTLLTKCSQSLTNKKNQTQFETKTTSFN